MNADNWIEHLQHPLVLASFGLFLFALVIRPLFSSSSKLSGAAIERVLYRGMILLFLLAITAILAGVMLSWKATPTPKHENTVKTTPESHLSSGQMPEEVQKKADAGLNSLAEKKKEQPLETVSSEKKKKITIRKYINNSDGTITDTETGLMWKRCPEGLSGENCEEGKAEGYEWDDAVERFNNVTHAGYSDWRLPTIDELKNLLYCSTGKNDDGDCNSGSEKPTINQQAFPNTGAWWWCYWSRSPNAAYSVYAWHVDFHGGYSGISYRHSGGLSAVRLVRSEQ